MLAVRPRPAGIGARRIYGERMDDAPDSTRPAVDPAEPEGGESACYAHLLCDECGAVQPGPHHAGCSVAASDGAR
jgi:hypothetical protein